MEVELAEKRDNGGDSWGRGVGKVLLERRAVFGWNISICSHGVYSLSNCMFSRQCLKVETRIANREARYIHASPLIQWNPIYRNTVHWKWPLRDSRLPEMSNAAVLLLDIIVYSSLLCPTFVIEQMSTKACKYLCMHADL
ncbi:hypothetical protein M0804_002247 [Polistes exclamans]|nr:hypothetical protein M0804_002247 [Polistes exclamans]